MANGTAEIRKFRLKVKWNSNSPENPFENRSLGRSSEIGSPSLSFGTERWKFPHHLVNFPVSSVSSAENKYKKSNCQW